MDLRALIASRAFAGMIGFIARICFSILNKARMALKASFTLLLPTSVVTRSSILRSDDINYELRVIRRRWLRTFISKSRELLTFISEFAIRSLSTLSIKAQKIWSSRYCRLICAVLWGGLWGGLFGGLGGGAGGAIVSWLMSIPFFEDDSHGDLSTVSSYYGPGAYISWVLTATLALFDTNSDSASVIGAILYPIFAAINLIYHISRGYGGPSILAANHVLYTALGFNHATIVSFRSFNLIRAAHQNVWLCSGLILHLLVLGTGNTPRGHGPTTTQAVWMAVAYLVPYFLVNFYCDTRPLPYFAFGRRGKVLVGAFILVHWLCKAYMGHQPHLFMPSTPAKITDLDQISSLVVTLCVLIFLKRDFLKVQKHLKFIHRWSTGVSRRFTTRNYAFTQWPGLHIFGCPNSDNETRLATHFQVNDDVPLNTIVTSGDNHHPVVPNHDSVGFLEDLEDRLFFFGRGYLSMETVLAAIELCRWLMTEGKDPYNSHLANHLRRISCHLSGQGYKEYALELIQDSVKIYRHLSAERPNSFDSDLSKALSQLYECLSTLRRRDQALETIEEAVTLNRLLAVDNPAIFNCELAKTLDTFSYCLADYDRCQEAVEASEEAVGLFRGHISNPSAGGNCHLAKALHQLSYHLARLNHQEKALQAIEEGIKVFRHLAADQPTIYNPDLAIALRQFAFCLYALDRRDEALKAVEEAVELHRLAADQPSWQLAGGLSQLYERLVESNRQEDALQAIKEAVRIYQRLAADQPSVFHSDLENGLNKLLHCLSALDRPQEALGAFEEAVDSYRSLATEQPFIFDPYLALSLKQLASYLSELDHPHRGIGYITEAVQIYRRLARCQPALFCPALASSLIQLSTCNSALNHRNEALKTIEEAVNLYQHLVVDQPALTDDLTKATSQLTLCLSGQGHLNETLGSIEEAAAV